MITKFIRDISYSRIRLREYSEKRMEFFLHLLPLSLLKFLPERQGCKMSDYKVSSQWTWNNKVTKLSATLWSWKFKFITLPELSYPSQIYNATINCRHQIMEWRNKFVRNLLVQKRFPFSCWYQLFHNVFICRLHTSAQEVVNIRFYIGIWVRSVHSLTL